MSLKHRIVKLTGTRVPSSQTHYDTLDEAIMALSDMLNGALIHTSAGISTVFADPDEDKCSAYPCTAGWEIIEERVFDGED
jgi:hypothetical protein